MCKCPHLRLLAATLRISVTVYFNIFKEKNLVSRLISQSNNLDFDYTIFQVHLNYYYEVLTLTFKLPLNVNVVNQSFKVPLLRTSNSFFQLLTFDGIAIR